ncbi:MAG: hypothetical protein KDD64_03905 [Bdellovibrionales bacterium]|nr:hypothetical protein [Bdellovibrionales bacterium]
MRFIHSFWFKPIIENPEKSWAGFSKPEYFWYCWALSLLTVRRHYQSAELYTDSHGMRFIQKLRLPYDNIHVVFDSLEDLRPEFWAYPKLLVFSLQQQPFLHLDTDVFLWKPLPDRLFQCEVFGQNFELQPAQHQFYRSLLEELRKHMVYLPASYFEEEPGEREFAAINCGIVGGRAVELFQSYSKECMEIFLRPENQEGWDKIFRESNIPSGLFNAAIEQWNLSLWGRDRHVEVLFSREQVESNYFKGESLGYTHLLGVSKSEGSFCAQIEEQLFQLAPKTKARIDEFCAEERACGWKG